MTQPEGEVTWLYSSYYSLVIEVSNRISGKTATAIVQRLETLKQNGILGNKDKLDVFLFNKEIVKITKKPNFVAKFDFSKLQMTTRSSNPIPSKGARLHDAVDQAMQHMRQLTDPEQNMNKILILFTAGKDTASTNVRSINVLSQKIINPQIEKFNMASMVMNMSSTSSLFKLVPPECRYCSLFYRGGSSRSDIDTVFEQLQEYLKQYRQEYEKLEKQRELELLKQRQLEEEEERRRLIELEKEKLKQLQLEQPKEELIAAPEPEPQPEPAPPPLPRAMSLPPLQPPPVVEPTDDDEEEVIEEVENQPPKGGIKKLLFIVFKWGVKRPNSKIEAEGEEEGEWSNEPETCFGISVKLLQGILLIFMLSYLVLAVFNLIALSKVLAYIIFISFAPISLTSQILDQCSKNPYYSTNELPRFFLGLFYIFLYWLWIFCFIITAFTDEFVFVVLNSGFVIIILCVEFLYRGFNEVKETYFDCEGGKLEKCNEVCEDSAVCGIQVRFLILSIFCLGCLIITAALLTLEGQDEHMRRTQPPDT